MSEETLLLLPLWYVAFLLSLTCHEAAHAWAAYRGGDETAYLGGQVSLNPVPHVAREPVGAVLVPLLSFLFYGNWMIGWASAPYDPDWEDRRPRRAALMAAAGPLANLLLAAAAFAVLKVGIAREVWVPAPEVRLDQLVVSAAEGAGALEGLGRFCSVLLSLNLVLFLFNLLPLPPLDGSAILSGLVPAARSLRDRMRSNSMSALIGLLIAWYLFPYLFGPVYGPVVRWLWQ